MLRKKLILSIAFLSIMGLTGLHAQETIPASGGNASGNGGSSSYTIGQMGYTTYTGTNGSVAQGVQQPFEISVAIGIEEAKEITLQCIVYPNPATDYINLKIGNYETENLTCQLYDINGKLLENKKVESNETAILMGSLVSSTYFLKIFDNKQEIKVFKIIKK